MACQDTFGMSHKHLIVFCIKARNVKNLTVNTVQTIPFLRRLKNSSQNHLLLMFCKLFFDLPSLMSNITLRLLCVPLACVFQFYWSWFCLRAITSYSCNFYAVNIVQVSFDHFFFWKRKKYTSFFFSNFWPKEHSFVKSISFLLIPLTYDLWCFSSFSKSYLNPLTFSDQNQTFYNKPLLLNNLKYKIM